METLQVQLPHIGNRWGVHYDICDRKVKKVSYNLPTFITELLFSKLRCLKPISVSSLVLNEANAIDYHRSMGHYLSSHVNDRQLSKEPIANLLLAGDCFMTYQINKKDTHLHKKDSTRVLLKQRTLQVLRGKSRYNYSHGIRKDDVLSEQRISITMHESPLTALLKSDMEYYLNI